MPSTDFIFKSIVLFVALVIRATNIITTRPTTDVSMNKNQFLYTIDEESFKNTIIADLIEDSGFKETLETSELKSLRFKQLNQRVCNFLVEETTGLVVVVGRIDREQLCPQQQHQRQIDHTNNNNNYYLKKQHPSSCVCRLDVVVTPMKLFRSIQVFINILDINDNIPSFLDNYITLEIIESSPVNSTLNLPNAVDADITPNHIVGYNSQEFTDANFTLQSSKPYFFFVQFENLSDGVGQLKLILLRTIDREILSSHYIVVSAFDDGMPSKTGSMQVLITIKDVNDNNPQFDYNFQEVKVSENVAIGSLVSRVTASDADEGDNAHVTYRFDDTTAHKYGQVFSIGETSGDIHVVGQIDFEETNVYKLMVKAEDKHSSSESRSADAIVVVNVADVNDNPPSISFSAFESTQSNTIGVEENLEEGSFVANIYVTDLDSSKNGDFMCFENSIYFSLKKVFLEGEFRLETKSSFDREITSEYFISITCSDNGLPSLTSHKTLNVQVIDTNDNKPSFKHSADVTLHVEENKHKEVLLFTFVATDNDQPNTNNSLITYSFEPRNTNNLHQHHRHHHHLHKNYFSINYSSGDLKSSREPVDRETHESFVFKVFACDNGRPRECDSMNVKIIIDDANDEKPLFPVKTFVFSLKENKPAGSELGIVTAKDYDMFPFNQHSFYMEKNNFEKSEKDFKSYGENYDRYYVDSSDRNDIVFDDNDKNKEENKNNYVNEKNKKYDNVKYANLKTNEQFRNNQTFILNEIKNIENQDNIINKTSILNINLMKNNPTDDTQTTQTSNEHLFRTKEDASKEKTHKLFHLESQSGRLATRLKLDRELRSYYRFAIKVIHHWNFFCAIFFKSFYKN